jgi:hypothetical protein
MKKRELTEKEIQKCSELLAKDYHHMDEEKYEAMKSLEMFDMNMFSKESKVGTDDFLDTMLEEMDDLRNNINMAIETPFGTLVIIVHLNKTTIKSYKDEESYDLGIINKKDVLNKAISQIFIDKDGDAKFCHDLNILGTFVEED